MGEEQESDDIIPRSPNSLLIVTHSPNTKNSILMTIIFSTTDLIQSLDHQSFTPVLDTFVQEFGDLIARVSIRALREAKLSFNELEVLLQKRPSVLQFLRQQRLRMGRTLNRATETAS